MITSLPWRRRSLQTRITHHTTHYVIQQHNSSRRMAKHKPRKQKQFLQQQSFPKSQVVPTLQSSNLLTLPQASGKMTFLFFFLFFFGRVHLYIYIYIYIFKKNNPGSTFVLFCTTCNTSYCGTLVSIYLFIYLSIKTHFGNILSRGLAHLM